MSRNNFFHKEATQNLYQLTGEDVKYSLANTISLTFEVTENCNLDCEYCIFGKYYLNKREEYKPIKLTSETAIKILNRVIPLWNSSLNSSFDKKLSIGFYGGEPLLNVCFIEKVVEYLKQSSLIDMNFIEFTMTTNGILLDKYISFLVENNFFIKISLDGGKETDNSYRKFKNGQSAYKNIYNNILLIKNEYPDYFEKNVDFISVLHDRNDHFEISKFFHTQFNKRANISELATDFLNPDTEIEFRKMYRSSSDVFTDRNNTHKSVSFDETLKFIRFHTGYFKTTYTDLLVKQNAPGYIPGGTCTPFSRKIFITNDGKILPCERISHQYEFGYVNEYEINLDFDMIAKEYNRYFSILYNQCRECIYKQQCGECMFQLNIGSNNFKCKNFRKKSERNIEKFLSENIT
ncbi:MAG: radical SAM peptide maturase, partial [Bacteroidales bacterium]|nr:radical SAM peptide maturase [Bacteroidales bacterium]